MSADTPDPQIVEEAERLLKDITPGEWKTGSWGGQCHKPHDGRGHPGPPDCVYEPVLRPMDEGGCFTGIVAAEPFVSVVDTHYDELKIRFADAQFIAASPRVIRGLLALYRAEVQARQEIEQQMKDLESRVAAGVPQESGPAGSTAIEQQADSIIEHGKTCHKVPHEPDLRIPHPRVGPHGGWLHEADDDGPYEVDGLRYCGRCHYWIG